MFNSGFYPTPPQVSGLMLKPFEHKDLQARHILEPSAGKGDLAEAVSIKRASYTFRGNRYGDKENHAIHCVEIEPELQATLRGKGFPLVSVNFLTFFPTDQYDLIVMNPPFADGEAHLLHAWEILYGGDIVCLLNVSTVDAPNTAHQKLLKQVIDANGTVERLGKCFKGSDVFREADVEVVLVRLHKPYPKIEFTFGDLGMEHDQAVKFEAEDLQNQVALNDKVGNLVLAHTKALEAFRRMTREMAELTFYTAPLGGFSGAMKETTKAITYGVNSDPQEQKKLYNIFSADLKKESWKVVFEMTKFSNFMTAKVKHDFDRFCADNNDLSFSVENIMRMMDSLFHSRMDIIKSCVVEVFDLMTSYDKKNVVHVEGWKTNDAHKVNRRVIIPICETGWDHEKNSWRREYHIPYGRNRVLDDIDRAMGFLVGKKLESIKSIRKTLEETGKLLKRGEVEFSDKMESDFFELRVYLKGTLHLYFKDEALWEAFNLEVARGKNWLPDDYKHREKATKKYGVAVKREW